MDVAWTALKNIAVGQKTPVGRKLTGAVGGAEKSVLFNAREGADVGGRATEEPREPNFL